MHHLLDKTPRLRVQLFLHVLRCADLALDLVSVDLGVARDRARPVHLRLLGQVYLQELVALVVVIDCVYRLVFLDRSVQIPINEEVVRLLELHFDMLLLNVDQEHLRGHLGQYRHVQNQLGLRLLPDICLRRATVICVGSAWFCPLSRRSRYLFGLHALVNSLLLFPTTCRCCYCRWWLYLLRSWHWRGFRRLGGKLLFGIKRSFFAFQLSVLGDVLLRVLVDELERVGLVIEEVRPSLEEGEQAVEEVFDALRSLDSVHENPIKRRILDLHHD